MSEPEIDAGAAVARLRASMAPRTDTEVCPLAAAGQRVLAADVVAMLDVPAFDNAAMDGYAVRARDCASGGGLRVVGRALAGHPFPGSLESGQAVRIMTGAAVPAGADAVVMLEDTHIDNDRVHFGQVPGAGLNIRPRGEHVRAGSTVLTRGRRLRAYDLGLAAAAGVSELTVMRTLKVGVLSTGDELHDPPHAVRPAGQYDGNRPMLLALIRHAGFEALDLGIVADRDDTLAERLKAAAALDLDAVISSGGVAEGDADIVRRFPALKFVPLALRPGRGIVCGRLDAKGQGLWFFGLPGNSVAAYVMIQLVVMPLLLHLTGAVPEAPLTLQMPLAVDTRARLGRVDWQRGRFVRHDGVLAVEPLPQQGSSLLRALSMADALVAIGPQASFSAGDRVDVIPLAALP